MLKKFSQLLSFGTIVLLVVSFMPLPQNLPTYALPGDWKPDAVSEFSHGTGISRSDNSTGMTLTNPITVGPSTTLQRIQPSDLIGAGAIKFDCSTDANNRLANLDNNHAFPDGIGYSSFNNYRNEFVGPPAPNTFFDSANNDEVERNYFGGAYDSNPVLGALDAKDDINLTSFADPNRDLYLLAHVHNNASTALNPIGTTDPRSSLPNGTGTKDLSARAVNTRMHFSVPSLAIPNSSQGTFVNRLRADNAYHIDNGNNCNDLIQQQVSDITKVTNHSGTPVTFIVKGGFIQNPFDDTGNSDIDFPPSALARLVDPSLNQSNSADPETPEQLLDNQGAKISSGKSAIGTERNVPNQPGCTDPNNTTQQANCNRFADPVLVGGTEFDGEWYGSREFVRYVGINVDAVAAEPRLSVSKLVRPVSPSPDTFHYYTSTGATISGNGNGEVEYEVLIQNTGNVDLDDVNFADLLPVELTPEFGESVADIVGDVEVCTNLTAAQNPATCTVAAPYIGVIPLNTSLGGHALTLSSSNLGIDATNPLLRDPTFITGGTSADGQVIRIRWRMTSVCSATAPLPIAHNYGLVSGSSSDVNATVHMLDGLSQYTDAYNISPTEWNGLFPNGASLGARQATNEVTVNLNRCNASQPGVTIGKFVHQVSPTAETFFPNPHDANDTNGGRTSTTITGTAGGEVQYEVLIQNTGSGAINTLSFGDSLPTTGLSLKSNTITVERCKDLSVATHVPDVACTDDVLKHLPDSSVSSGILYIAGSDMGTIGVTTAHPLNRGEVIRIRWSMISVCNNQPPRALNYGMVMGGSGATTNAGIQVFPGLVAHTPSPYVPTEAQMQERFTQRNGQARPTNDTFVTLNPCSPPPPPTPRKFASTTPHPTGTSFPTPTSFNDANSTGAAVDFGERTAPYTAYFRVTLTNTGTGSTELAGVIMDDEFHLRNGAAVTPQSVVEPVGSRLDSFDVVAGTETTMSPDTLKVQYLGASPTTPNGLRFIVPRIRPGQTIAFYYSIVVDPTVASPARPTGTEYHRNIVRVCFPTPSTPTGACIDAGHDDAYISDHTPTPTSQVITIIKTVNGQDADTDATAVSVANGGGLSYAITITAPSTNTATVTGISLTDTVTTLPNVTGITNIRLQTPAAPCVTPCSIANIQTELPTRTFDLAPGQSAVLTYQATATNTGTSTSAFNRNIATATPRNAPAVSNPATIVVPGHREPETNFKIEKKVSPQVVKDGDEVEYTITVEPDGDNDDIAGLVLLITDDINDDGTLSQGGVTLTYVRNSTDIETDDADCSGEMDDEDGIRCEDVSKDDEIEITYKAKVSVRNLICPETVTVDNTAKLRDDTPNVDIKDEDDAEVRTICTPKPSDRPLNITKNVQPNEIRQGQIAHYTITVQNPNSTTVTTRLTDTIGLNNGVVAGPLGGYARYNANSLQVTGAAFSGSIDNPDGIVLNIPALSTAMISYTATGDTNAQPFKTTDLAPNTASLDNGLTASAFIQLPKTGPESAGLALGFISAIGAYIATRKRKK